MRGIGLRERLPEDPEDFRATLAEHLDELRFRLIRSAIALCIGALLGWFAYPPLFNHLINMVVAISKTTHGTVDWRFGSVMEPFMLQLKMSFYIGLGFALPYIVGELWGFIRPALRPTEVKPFKVVVPVSLGLVVLGAWLGYFVWPATVKWFVEFAVGQTSIGIIQNPYDMLVLCVKMMLIFGVSFQLPLIVFFLAKVGILSPDFLWKYWKHCTVGVFTAVAIFSPTADPFSMVALALPLTVLVFGSILAAKISFGSKGASELDHLD
ncbi:MAG: twin-arginine translocase subunit TatC [Armatimonadota bacterium]